MAERTSTGGSAPAAGPRSATLLLLAAWLGAALLTTTVVAPAAFAVLPTRTLAGALVGRVLPPLCLGGALAGALVAWAAWVERRSGGGGRGTRARVALGATVVVACLAAQLGVAPRIERLRSSAGVPMDSLAPTDARRVAFGRLHGASVAALGAAMLAGGIALVLGARAPRRGAGVRGS